MVKVLRILVLVMVVCILLAAMSGCDLRRKTKVKDNIALANLWIGEVWHKGVLTAVDELCADNFTFNYPMPGFNPDKEGYKKTWAMYNASFEGIKCEVVEMVADIDKVAVRWACSSKHNGNFMGIAPTGKEVTMSGISILKMQDMKIVEEYTEMDMMGMFSQLGMYPIPGAPAEAATEEAETTEAEEEVPEEEE